MDQYKSTHVLVVYEEGKSTTSLSQEGLWEKPGHMKDLALHEIARILHVRRNSAYNKALWSLKKREKENQLHH